MEGTGGGKGEPASLNRSPSRAFLSPLPSASPGPTTPSRYGGPSFLLGAADDAALEGSRGERLDEDLGLSSGSDPDAAPPPGAVFGRPRLIDRRRPARFEDTGESLALEDSSSSVRTAAERCSSLAVSGPFPWTGRVPSRAQSISWAAAACS